MTNEEETPPSGIIHSSFAILVSSFDSAYHQLHRAVIAAMHIIADRA
jgi:hypothetical protein